MRCGRKQEAQYFAWDVRYNLSHVGREKSDVCSDQRIRFNNGSAKFQTLFNNMPRTEWEFLDSSNRLNSYVQCLSDRTAFLQNCKLLPTETLSALHCNEVYWSIKQFSFNWQ